MGVDVHPPRTVRELREAIHALEAALERAAMAPAVALTRFAVGYQLREARLALRRADRDAARNDDPRLPELPVLRPQIRDRRPSLRPRRRRYRCPVCFEESLRDPGGDLACYRRGCDAEVQPVAPLKRRAA